MIEKVIKRDGSTVAFDKSNIVNAILKAMGDTEKGYDAQVAEKIAQDIQNSSKKELEVEEIQDLVELKLMASKRKDVAKSYILFREQRNKARGRKSYETYMDIVNTVANDITKENANMNADSPAGMMMKFASETSKQFVDDCLLSDKANEFIKENKLHVHDKDYYPTKSLTCLQHPLDQLLQNGFRAGHGASRPAKRIETAAIIGCISMESIQNEMHGGQAVPAFDFYLAPYVRETFIEELYSAGEFLGKDIEHLKSVQFKDYEIKPLAFTNNSEELSDDNRIIQYAINRTTKRVHQAMESFIHNMNTIHSRGGNQVVFSSINYGTDTSAEGRCIIRELLKSTYRGVGNGETAIFPIQIWKSKSGVSYLPGDPNYDLYELACKVTAKRFFPNFVNLDSTFNQNEAWKAEDPARYMYEVATMGCRTRVFENRHGEKTSVGRGNLSFSTINIVRLALECKDIEDQPERIKVFFSKLDECLDVTAEQLYDRYRFQCTAKKKQFPMLMSGMWMDSDNLAPDDEVAPVLKHGTLGVGFIGLAECLVALIGKHHGESEEAQKLGLRIVTTMRDRVSAYAEKYNLNFSVLATPAEGLSGKFTKKDRREFGIIEGVTDREYYTNSNHVPVYYHCSVQHKAEVEAPYHDLTRGGHIFYVEMDGDATHNPDAVMKVVELMHEYNMGYGSINHTRTRCLDCGYENAQKDLKVCPKCGSSRIDCVQRITGYLVGTTNSWNDAKKAELRDRVTHTTEA